MTSDSWPGAAPWVRSIHHDGSGRYVRLPEGGVVEIGDEVEIRLRAAPEAPIDRILLRTCPDGEQSFVEMKPAETSGACRWWSAVLRLSMPTVHYRFLVFTSVGAFWLNGSGVCRHVPTDAEDFRLLTDYVGPRWLRDAVFYQIFPDRFSCGDPATSVRDDEFTYRGQPARARPWGSPPTVRGPEAMVEFFGGDLRGIEGRLEYLGELGIDAIYLNPVFTAHSNHRYDVIDYENVDPHLGGNTALASLREATRAAGIRYLLDVVPNHCGADHPWFKAALADQTAPTAEFFTFLRHPDEYLCWLEVKSLPKLNYSSRALRERMYAGADSVFRRWLRPPYSADGWRIDVANMLGRQGANQLGLEIAAGIRWSVKEENPEAYLLGEHFFDASGMLQGTCWDAVMNYTGFSQPLWYWLAGYNVRQHGVHGRVTSRVPWPTEALVDTWAGFRSAVPWAIARQQFNLLGSHDTPRIKSVVGGDPALCRLAAGVLMTYVGVPCVYYGDEIGLVGTDGDESRGCMPWDRSAWDLDLREYYRKLIALRKRSPALAGGGFQVLAIERDAVVYQRDADDETVVVIANRGPGSRPAGPVDVRHGGIADGTRFEEVFTGAVHEVVGGRIELPSLPSGVMILRHGA